MDVADESVMDTSAAACEDTPAAASIETDGTLTAADSGGATADTNTTADSASIGGELCVPRSCYISMRLSVCVGLTHSPDFIRNYPGSNTIALLASGQDWALQF